jgi:hypothetical protein
VVVRFLRLALIGLGALASVATSKLPEGVELETVLPRPDETGVPVGAAIELHFFVNDHPEEPSPRFAFLRQPDASRLEASATWDGQIMTLRPMTPFAPDTDYVLVVEDPGWLADARWQDPLTGASVEGRPFAEFELPFSTRLTPIVRMAWRGVRVVANGQQTTRTPEITLSFSRAMDPASLRPDNVSVFVDETRVPISVAYTEGDLHSLTVVAPTLDPQLTATVVLGEGIRATDGTPLTPTQLDVMP